MSSLHTTSRRDMGQWCAGLELRGYGLRGVGIGGVISPRLAALRVGKGDLRMVDRRLRSKRSSGAPRGGVACLRVSSHLTFFAPVEMVRVAEIAALALNEVVDAAGHRLLPVRVPSTGPQLLDGHRLSGVQIERNRFAVVVLLSLLKTARHARRRPVVVAIRHK
jgi:hypothetical protein